MSPAGAAPGRCLDQWTISGEVVLIGEPSAPVRLAGYYTCCHDFFYASRLGPDRIPARLVTSVADLGREGGPFSLCFDVTSLCPEAGHYIYLVLWADGNGNGAYDPGEDWKYVIPLYDDQVFGDATDCVYYFDDRAREEKGTQPGWNQSTGLERYAPVEQACRDGARLANETAWSARQGIDPNSRTDIDLPTSKDARVSPGGLAQLVERQVRNL